MQNIHARSFVTKHWLTVSRAGASMLNNGLKKTQINAFCIYLSWLNTINQPLERKQDGVFFGDFFLCCG